MSLCGTFDGLIALAGDHDSIWTIKEVQRYLDQVLDSNLVLPYTLWILLMSTYTVLNRWAVVTSCGLALVAVLFLEFVLWSAEQRYAWSCSGPVSLQVFEMPSCTRLDLIAASGKTFDEKYCCASAIQLLPLKRDWMWTLCNTLLFLVVTARAIGCCFWFYTWATSLPLRIRGSNRQAVCDFVRRATDETVAWLDGTLTGAVDKQMDKVLAGRTDQVAIVIPQSPGTKDIKVILSTENNTGMTRAKLESAMPGNPLKTMTPAAGPDVNRLARSQVLLTNEDGVVCGMGSYVKTVHGFRLITLRHVLLACTQSSPVVLAVSPITRAGMKVTPLQPSRETTFRVGEHVDVRVLLIPPANFAARLSLTAATMKESFKEGHGVVFTPPEDPDEPLRYCSGKVGKLGSTGMLTFSGSTMPGSSGGGVFVGNHMVSTHVGTLEGMQKNVSFYNIPQSGPPANTLVRSTWLSAQSVTPESAFPETRPWMLVQQLQEHEDGDTHFFTDVDAEGDRVKVTRYEALADEYAEKRSQFLEKNAKTTAALVSALTSSRPSWADEDEEDQMVLQDMHEEPNKEKAARTGKRGILKQGSVIPQLRFETIRESDSEIDNLDEEISATKKLIAETESVRLREERVLAKHKELMALKQQLLGDRFVPESVVAAPNSLYDKDFGNGEQPPRSPTAIAVQLSRKASKISLESPLVEITTSSKTGSTSACAPLLKKKNKKKKKARSSESGASVTALVEETPLSSPLPISTLASLMEKLEAMDRRIGELALLRSP